MTAGLFYDSETPDLVETRVKVRQKILEFNNCGDPDFRMQMLPGIFGSIGEDSFVETGLRVDYGFNIRMGKRCFVNFNAVMLDCGPIDIGDDVLIGPNVSFLTPVHPLVAEERIPRYDTDGRLYKIQYTRGITVEDRVWIGGNVAINGGVRIGHDTVIGSGSVVTRDIPPGVFAAGNPCRVIRSIDSDKDSLLSAYAAQCDE